jgi:hypothetical protein
MFAQKAEGRNITRRLVNENRNVRTQKEREWMDPEMGENPGLNPEAGKIQRMSRATSTQED